MFLIVTLHVYGHGSNLDYDWIYSLGKHSISSWNLSLYSLSKIGVTGFMFISGYYGINYNKNKLANLVFSCVFYGLLLGLLTQMPLIEFLYIPFTFDMYWFISSYIVIFVISPLLNEGIKVIKKKGLLLICAMLLIYSYLLKFIKMDNSHDLTFLLSVFLTARYYRLYIADVISMKWNNLIQLIGLFSALLLIFIPVILARTTLPSAVCMKLFIQNNNILILLTITGLISFMSQHSFNSRIINTLSSGALAIYLVTEFPTVRPTFTQYLLPHVLSGLGLIYIVAICIFILIFDQSRQYIFNKTLNKLIK